MLYGWTLYLHPYERAGRSDGWREPAPGFCLPGADEREVCLEEYDGRWLVLYFYPRDNTSGCTLEARTFSGELDEFAAIGARIVGVSPDSPASHKKFAESKELRVCLLSDEEHAVMEEYGVWKKKRMYGREFMGVERSHVPHRSGGGHPCEWRKVRVPGHVETVKEALQALS
jgi:peroxiredoxin Q/BCP